MGEKVSDNGLLWLLLALPFAGSLAAAFLPVNARNAAGVLAGAVALAGTILAAILYSRIAGGAVVRSEIEWLPSLGLDLIVRLDGLSCIFAFLVLAVGFLVVVYARFGLHDHGENRPVGFG